MQQMSGSTSLRNNAIVGIGSSRVRINEPSESKPFLVSPEDQNYLINVLFPAMCLFKYSIFNKMLTKFSKSTRQTNKISFVTFSILLHVLRDLV